MAKSKSKFKEKSKISSSQAKSIQSSIDKIQSGINKVAQEKGVTLEKQKDNTYKAIPKGQVEGSSVGPKVSTTTISNANKMSQVPGMVNELDTYANKGVQTDELGNQRYADGSFVEEDVVETPKKSKEVDPYDTSAEDKQTENLLKQMQKSSDAQTKATLDNIRQKFDIRKQQQEKINSRAQKQVQNALLTGGVTGQGSSAQYAPISSVGIVQAQESYGLQQIATLDAQEQDLIFEAKAAQQEQNYRLMETKLAEIKEKRLEKVEAAKALNEAISKKNEEDLKIQEQMDRESAVSTLFTQGVTDVGEVLKQLKSQGIRATAKDVSDTIALYTGDGGEGEVGYYNDLRKQYLSKGLVPPADLRLRAHQQWGAAGRAPEKPTGDGATTEGDPIYAGLSPQTSTAVRGQVTAWKGEPQVQNFATIQDGYNFASSLSDTTVNPADDQALIYALAKALDPGSVVREGEYATAQKYAQSWAKAYGKKITQAIAGTGFLSEEARRNIKKTIETKYTSTKRTYDQLRGSYVGGINSLTGRKDGDKFLREYSTGASEVDQYQVKEDQAEVSVLEKSLKDPKAKKAIQPLIDGGVPFQEIMTILPEFF